MKYSRAVMVTDGVLFVVHSAVRRMSGTESDAMESEEEEEVKRTKEDEDENSEDEDENSDEVRAAAAAACAQRQRQRRAQRQQRARAAGHRARQPARRGSPALLTCCARTAGER